MKGQYEFECYETKTRTKWRNCDFYRANHGETIIYRFRFKAPNGKTLFPSHPYDSKAARTRGIAAIRKGVPGAKVTQA